MFLELRLMFSLMDRVPDGITQMLVDLENYIFHQGLADMMAAAESITTVSYHIIFVNECNYKLNSNQVKLCRSVLLMEETRENELIKVQIGIALVDVNPDSITNGKQYERRKNEF